MKSRPRPKRPKIFSRSKINRRTRSINNELAVDEQEEFIVRPRNKAIYLLPNAFTTVALFFGFFSL